MQGAYYKHYLKVYLLLKKSQLFPLLCTSLSFLFKSFLKFKQSKQIKYKLFCCERLQKECISGSAMPVESCLFLRQSFSFIGRLSPTINLFLNIKATKMNDVFITFVPSVRFQLLATCHTLLSSALICYNTVLFLFHLLGKEALSCFLVQ